MYKNKIFLFSLCTIAQWSFIIQLLVNFSFLLSSYLENMLRLNDKRKLTYKLIYKPISKF